MNAKQLILEKKKPSPDWAGLKGVYADLTDWPASVSYYCKCPKCGSTHGSFKSMKEAHAKRLCNNCDVKAINDLKDYIAKVDAPDQEGKPGKSIAKIFHEAEEMEFPEDNIDPMELLDRIYFENWMRLAVHQLSAKRGIEFTPLEGVFPEDPDSSDKIPVDGDDGSEWIIFKNNEAARAEALAHVRQELEMEPELFTRTWLEAFIDLEKLKRELLYDKDWRNDFVNSYDGLDDQIDYLIQQDFLNEDDFYTPTGKRRKMSPSRQRLLDQAIDAWGEEEAQEFDPMEYMRDIYGRDEYFKEAIILAGIDVDRAAESAVDTDGWQHFLGQYDGNSTELESGAVATRIN